MTGLRGTVVCVDFTISSFIAFEAITLEAIHQVETYAVATVHTQTLVNVLFTMVPSEAR